MAADKLKKLEARGRAAFIQGDISSATRYFMQALEKQNSPEYSKPKALTPKPRREKPRSKSLLSLNNNNNNNEDDQVWILQANTNEKRNKKNEKHNGKKKAEKESGVEMLDGIIGDADTAITSFPSYPMGYLRKASALILINQWEEARQTYTAGIEHCSEKSLLKSALYNLNKTHKMTSCAANLDTQQLSELLNEKISPSPTIKPPNPAVSRRNRFRLQGQRRLTKKLFPKETDAFSIPQIQATSFRRRNSSSTDTHL